MSTASHTVREVSEARPNLPYLSRMSAQRKAEFIAHIRNLDADQLALVMKTLCECHGEAVVNQFTREPDEHLLGDPDSNDA